MRFMRHDEQLRCHVIERYVASCYVTRSHGRAARSRASSVTERISCAYHARSSRDLSSYLPASRARGLNFTDVFRCYNVSFLSSVFPEIVMRDTSFVGSSFSSPVPLSSRKKKCDSMCYILFYILRR